MESTGYITLTRQSGLLREMQVVANNVANAGTAGFRREGVIFSEFVRRAGEAPSLSMASGGTRQVDLTEGGITRTGGTFDFAIRGEGFFMVDTADGPRLTRAGTFTPGPDGVLANPDGHPLLDAGGTAVTIPPDVRSVLLGADGTLTGDGAPIARIGLWLPADPLALRHEGGTRFEGGEAVPAPTGQILQGALEDSNVDPVLEVARMIEVQRAYELGQGFLDREDERMRGLIRTIGG